MARTALPPSSILAVSLTGNELSRGIGEEFCGCPEHLVSEISSLSPEISPVCYILHLPAVWEASVNSEELIYLFTLLFWHGMVYWASITFITIPLFTLSRDIQNPVWEHFPWILTTNIFKSSSFSLHVCGFFFWDLASSVYHPSSNESRPWEN